MKRYNKLHDAMMPDPEGLWLKWEDVAGQALQMMRKDDRIAALEAELSQCEIDRDRYAREANKFEAALQIFDPGMNSLDRAALSPETPEEIPGQKSHTDAGK